MQTKAKETDHHAALPERTIDGKERGDALQERNESCLVDQIVEVDSPDDGMAFIVIDSVMTLLVYLAPAAVFGYKVAPVVASLLSTPITN